MNQVLFLGDHEMRPVYKASPSLAGQPIYPLDFRLKTLLRQEENLDRMSPERQEEYSEYLKVIKMKAQRFTQVACGSDAGYILDGRNELWVLGSNRSGELGLPFIRED